MKKTVNNPIKSPTVRQRLLPLLGLALSLTSMTALAADKVSFQLDWLPGGDKAPVYVGLQQGFFAEQGLDVKVAQGVAPTMPLPSWQPVMRILVCRIWWLYCRQKRRKRCRCRRFIRYFQKRHMRFTCAAIPVLTASPMLPVKK